MQNPRMGSREHSIKLPAISQQAPRNFPGGSEEVSRLPGSFQERCLTSQDGLKAVKES